MLRYGELRPMTLWKEYYRVFVSIFYMFPLLVHLQLYWDNWFYIEANTRSINFFNSWNCPRLTFVLSKTLDNQSCYHQYVQY